MEKPLCRVTRKLADIPGGCCINIRHPINRAGTACKSRQRTEQPEIAEQKTEELERTDTALPPEAKLCSETYELYPGIELSFHCYLGDKFHIHHRHGLSVLSVDHCRSGRIGWEMKDGLSLYFGSGDLSFHLTDKCSDSEITLPLGYYEGLSVSMDLNILNENMPDLLTEAGIDIKKLCEKFCGRKETAALPANSRIEHIFSEVYDIPEQMKLPYLKLKCQELLLFLNMTEPADEKTLDPHYSDQIEIIREIHDRMTAHPECRYTIDELAREYLINTAALKSIFKSVYGMPVASYMKQYRISRACCLLRESDMSISAVARAVGYESQSKFTAAFKDIMKILPTDYRRQYT